MPNKLAARSLSRDASKFVLNWVVPDKVAVCWSVAHIIRLLTLLLVRLLNGIVASLPTNVWSLTPRSMIDKVESFC